MVLKMHTCLQRLLGAFTVVIEFEFDPRRSGSTNDCIALDLPETHQGNSLNSKV